MEVCTGRLLETITAPEDIRSLSRDELIQLAQEIRASLIDLIPRTGGHFASSLGNVELIIALHAAYESPHDAIVWDVSHGCYPHKFLTGRHAAFATLRQLGGISGFLSPAESEHDIAPTGHAGTALSTALGIAWARRYTGHTGKVVAVVGDGSIGIGMSQEALSNMSSLGVDLTVILNDNQWSIDPTPGGMAQALDASRQRILEAPFFDGLGIRYLGPVDGHHLPLLISVLKKVQELSGPTLVHVLTQKGKGYPPAEEDPAGYHALPPPGGSKSGRSFSEVFGASLIQLAAADPRIVAISAGMIGGTGLTAFREAFPHRCFDVGIAEEHAVTFAGGLSVQGLKPVVAIYSTFLQRAYDQIVHDICLPCRPVVFALDRGGVVGRDGPTHHGVFDLAYLRHMPNMVILAPSSAPELERHLHAALQQAGPVALRYPRGKAPDTDWGPEETVVIGTSRTLRQGTDAAVLVAGSMVPVVLEAARVLHKRGTSLEVVEARSLKPLDVDAIIDLAQRHSVLVSVEDHVIIGGFGSSLAELLCGKPRPCLSILGWPDMFIEHGDIEPLRMKYGLAPEGLADQITGFLEAAAPTREGDGEEKSAEPPPVAASGEHPVALIEELRQICLSDTIEEARREYEQVGDRDSFLWKWVRRGVEITSLSCVEEARWDHVCDTKTLGVMFDVLVDDVADKHGDAEFLERLIAVTEGKHVSSARLGEEQRAYLRFSEEVWRRIGTRVESYPRYQEFREILEYDYRQLMNVMRYSLLIQKHPQMMNISEHDAYLPHNMHMIISGTMDLMASPRFDAKELGRLRQVLWFAQEMGRIGNLVTTWEREIGERDFSSGVFALGLTERTLTVEDLLSDDHDRIARTIREAGVEGRFLARWHELRRRIIEMAEGFSSVRVEGLVEGLESLIQLHLASRGLK